MLGSPLLGTAVGLTLLFATTALLCSGITETLSNIFQMRAKYLLTGLRGMLDRPEAKPGTSKTDDKNLHNEVKQPGQARSAADAVRAGSVDPSDPQLSKALFDSPLLMSMQSRRVTPFVKGSVRNPQYLSGQAFARALVDLLVPATADGDVPIALDIGTITQTVMKLPPTLPVRRQLLVFLAAAGTDVEAFERRLEQWYDEEMAKISGWYKRWARVALGIVGLIIAGAANIDTLQVTTSLYVDAPLQQAVAATAASGTLCQDKTASADQTKCVDDELASLKAAGLPVGWSEPSPSSEGSWALKILGWVITAFAVSFGAPFWFEALSKLGSLRNAGTRPGDK